MAQRQKGTAGVTTVDGVTGTITTGGTNSVKVDGINWYSGWFD